MTDDVSELERGNLEKYGGKFYHADRITVFPPAGSQVYTDVLLQLRLDLVAQYAQSATVLDLCCGSGEHLIHFACKIKEGKGLDYSVPFVARAKKTTAELGIQNIEFVQGNARKMPFENSYFDLVYSFSSLYYIPNVEEVVNEIARVLRPLGKCVLDLGNLYSLNTISCRYYPDYAEHFDISVLHMRQYFRNANLNIQIHRAFQILPLWADRPKWLKPLLLPCWTRLLSKQVKGKMLDEWLSNLPGLNLFAFRHVFVCEKKQRQNT